MKRLTLVSITILYSLMSYSQSLTKERCYEIIYNSIKNRKIQIEDVNITTNDRKEFQYTNGDNKLVYKNGVAHQYFESTETFVKANVDFFLVHPLFEILQIEYFTKGIQGDGYIQFYTEYLNDEFNEMKWTLHFNESNDLVSIESYYVQFETSNKIDVSIISRKFSQIAEYQPESLPNYNNIRVVSTTSSNLKEASLPSDITEVDQVVQKISSLNYQYRSGTYEWHGGTNNKSDPTRCGKVRIQITSETINFEIIENCGLTGIAYREEESFLYQYYSKLFSGYNSETKKRSNIYFSGTNNQVIGLAHFSYGIGFEFGDFEEIKFEEMDRNTLKLIDPNVGEFIFKRL